MSQPKLSQYQAYSIATRTVPKTRQIVMLYDGAIRFLKQARTAIAEKRIEDRFRLLARASDVMAGLQNSIDYDNGGEVAMTLHRFYTNMCVRILSINFNPGESSALCENVIDELKQMRDVWHNIDRTLDTSGSGDAAAAPIASSTAAGASSANVTLSA
jgi:flagellar protein FliS